MNFKGALCILTILILLFSNIAFAKNLIPELLGKPIVDWTPPEVEKSELKNGFQLYLLEDHDLPLFKATLFIKVGNVQEPYERSGLSALTANLLTTGGSGDKTPDQVDAWLDQNAMDLSAEAGQELTAIHISCLAQQWREALHFLGEVLWNPKWDSDRFQLAIQRSKEAIRREEDEPNKVVAKAFIKTLYGQKHPWARVPSLESLEHIKIEDLKEFYRRYYHPNRMLLAVGGDFSSGAVKKWFQNWGEKQKGPKLPKTNMKMIPFETKSEDKVIKKDLTQAFIEVGHFGIDRHSKDRYTYGLLQYILGGETFTSRLGKDIRTTQGLAYTVYSHWEAHPVRGYFKIHVETRAEARDAVLKSIKSHLIRLSKQGDVTVEELQLAKEALLNQFIFLFDSPFETLLIQARVDLLGFPKNYLKEYPDNIRQVTLKGVQEVAKKYIHPEGLKVVVVGP